ncbi:MAG: CRISPR system precrRNA processing endoribonuclease RAMP protein Cas6 [Anaerolineaceae bacterium]
MQIRSAFFNSQQHPLAESNTYETIWDETVRNAGRLPAEITLSFNSLTFFKSTQTGGLTPFPSPALVFGSLFDRWKACTSLEMPVAVKSYVTETMHITTDRLQLVTVDTGKNERTGAVGNVTYISDNPSSPYWLFIHILARFAMYAGVGKETASGFGQCRLEESF